MSLYYFLFVGKCRSSKIKSPLLAGIKTNSIKENPFYIEIIPPYSICRIVVWSLYHGRTVRENSSHWGSV